MNLPTVIITLAVAALLGLAIRYMVKNGACAACGMSESCTSHKKGGAAASAGCGGKCSACQYYAYEQQLAAAVKAKHAAHPQS